MRSPFELAEHCGFAASRDEQIRDRIVIGISDKELSQKLQLKSTLTPDQALEMAGQSEQIKAQVSDQTHGLTSSSKDLQEVRGHWYRRGKRGNCRGNVAVVEATRGKPEVGQGGFHSQRAQNGQINQHCKACGRGHRPDGRCPAAGKACYKCHEIGHFGARCVM